MFIENLIGSRAKVKILRVLSEIRTAFTLTNIKKDTELSLGIVHKSLEELTEEGIVIKIKGTGKERLFKFNTESPFATPIFDLFRIEKTRQRKEAVILHTWSVAENAVSKLKDKALLIALFGSQARGMASVKSDIDLLIIHDKNEDEILDIMRKVKSKTKIQSLTMSVNAFKDHIKGNTLLYKNIKSDAIIFHINPKIKKDISQFLEEIKYQNGQRI